jgi:hypothetical protein
MIEVVGYEGSPAQGYPLVWGSAAVHNTETGRVTNAGIGGYGMSYDEWRRLSRSGKGATATQIKIPVDLAEDIFVADMSLELLDKEPYKLSGDLEFDRISPGVIAVGRGRTRGYYVFQNHDRLKSWIYHMNAGPYKLVSP